MNTVRRAAQCLVRKSVICNHFWNNLPTAFISIVTCPSSLRMIVSRSLSCDIFAALARWFMNINSVLPKYNVVTPLSLRSLHSTSETLLVSTRQFSSDLLPFFFFFFFVLISLGHHFSH